MDAWRLSRTASRARVLFVSSADRKIDGSRLYRCDYQAKQLSRAGIDAEVVYVGDASAAQARTADLVIFSRCVWEPRTVALIDAARQAGAVICGDLDDKIYAPWDIDSLGYLRGQILLTGQAKERFGLAEGQRNRLKLLPAFDLILVSTPGIADELFELGLDAHVSRNAFDTDVAAPIRRRRRELRRVLVMAGTKTHDADVRLLARPLAQFLYENEDVECSFLGPLVLSGQLAGLPNLKRHGLISMERLPSFIATHDVCLVPLEDSGFNDCKSAIKFVECGLASVPVIASPRREFRALVRDGENGFLAEDDPASWYDLLGKLRDTPALLEKVAAAAHETVISEHTVVSRGTSLADFLLSLIEKKRGQVPRSVSEVP